MSLSEPLPSEMLAALDERLAPTVEFLWQEENYRAPLLERLPALAELKPDQAAALRLAMCAATFCVRKLGAALAEADAQSTGAWLADLDPIKGPAKANSAYLAINALRSRADTLFGQSGTTDYLASALCGIETTIMPDLAGAKSLDQVIAGIIVNCVKFTHRAGVNPFVLMDRLIDHKQCSCGRCSCRHTR